MGDLRFSIVISNTDSTSMYSTNSPSSFCIELPYVIRLPGNWTCSVDSVYSSVSMCSNPPSCIHVLLDFVRPSVAYGKEIRIGGTFPLECTNDNKTLSCSSSTEHTVYIEKQVLERINVDIVTNTLEKCDLLSQQTIIVLTFTRQNGERGEGF